MISIQQIYDRLITSGLAKTESIVGCSDQQLQAISEIAGRELPDFYRDFMKTFGCGAGRFLRDVELFYPAVLSLRPIAEDIVTDYEEYNIQLPSSAFVFAMRQKEQFMFFDELGSNPPVRFYMSDQPSIVTIADTFMDVIVAELNQAEASYASIRGTPYDLYE